MVWLFVCYLCVRQLGQIGLGTNVELNAVSGSL